VRRKLRLVGPTRCGIVGRVVDVATFRGVDAFKFTKAAVYVAANAFRILELVTTWLGRRNFEHRRPSNLRLCRVSNPDSGNSLGKLV